MKSKTFLNVWAMALNPLNLILILVMVMVSVSALACGDGEPLHPETVSIDIEVNAL